jgi:hypothetical protein
VTSRDGFEGDYTVTSTTKVRVGRQLADVSALHVGDRVGVLASGGQARRVVERQTPLQSGNAPGQNSATPGTSDSSLT